MIYVRSRVGSPLRTEWMEKTKSWKKAWAIIKGCGAVKAQCRKWQSGQDWFLDIEDLKEITVVVNDRSMAYTNEQATHLCYGSKKTLCGVNSRPWLGKPQNIVWGYLCPKCEKSAVRGGLKIPYAQAEE